MAEISRTGYVRHPLEYNYGAYNLEGRSLRKSMTRLPWYLWMRTAIVPSYHASNGTDILGDILGQLDMALRWSWSLYEFVKYTT